VTSAVGVLALQGGFAPHVRILRGLGRTVREVRHCRDVDGLGALVLPGGESTAMLELMQGEPWLDALRAFAARGGALLGTCAGIILLAREVDPPQPSAGLLDVVVARNAYGRQTDSFEAPVSTAGSDTPLRGVFIRAPRIRAVGAGASVLARVGEAPVAVREGRVLGITFHPELVDDDRMHRMLIGLAA
jgi:pyridoxal 5'-phosphate synthase pdxT subunit